MTCVGLQPGFFCLLRVIMTRKNSTFSLFHVFIGRGFVIEFKGVAFAWKRLIDFYKLVYLLSTYIHALIVHL